MEEEIGEDKEVNSPQPFMSTSGPESESTESLNFLPVPGKDPSVKVEVQELEAPVSNEEWEMLMQEPPISDTSFNTKRNVAEESNPVSCFSPRA